MWTELASRGSTHGQLSMEQLPEELLPLPPGGGSASLGEQAVTLSQLHSANNSSKQGNNNMPSYGNVGARHVLLRGLRIKVSAWAHGHGVHSHTARARMRTGTRTNGLESSEPE
jgi:hypothetical protein